MRSNVRFTLFLVLLLGFIAYCIIAPVIPDSDGNINSPPSPEAPAAKTPVPPKPGDEDAGLLAKLRKEKEELERKLRETSAPKPREEETVTNNTFTATRDEWSKPLDNTFYDTTWFSGNGIYILLDEGRSTERLIKATSKGTFKVCKDGKEEPITAIDEATTMAFKSATEPTTEIRLVRTPKRLKKK